MKKTTTILAFAISFCGYAQNQTVNGDLTVTGNIDATGSGKRIYLGGITNSTFGIGYNSSYPDHGIFYTEGNPDFVSISPNGNSTNGVLNVYGNGYVGIGHTAPLSALHIKGTNNLTSQIRLENTAGNAHWKVIAKSDNDRLSFQAVNSSDSEVLSLSANGYIGMGTTSPGARLEIFNTEVYNTNDAPAGQDHILFSSNDPGNGNYYGGLTWNSGGRRRASIAAVREHDDTDYVGLAFFTRGTDGPGPMYESMRIARNGNVGIGVKPDHAKLEIKQTANLEALRIDGASGAFAMVVKGGSTNTTHLRSGLTIGQNYFVAPPANGAIIQGNVGIGTTTPGTYKLAVEGKIGARSVKVTTASWADYVFAPSYALMSLPETEAYIKENQHLPNIPSAAEVKENGFHLEEMDAKLLAKIEELTLHLIAQEKRLAAQQAEIQTLKTILKKHENQ